MLDPRKRQCSKCKEEERNGIPIPNCDNPDGMGEPCGFPGIAGTFLQANRVAWNLWVQYPEQIVKTDVTMAGAMFTLNLDSLVCLFEMMRVEGRPAVYRKVRAIFEVWREIQDQLENKKTKQSMERTKSMRRNG